MLKEPFLKGIVGSDERNSSSHRSLALLLTNGDCLFFVFCEFSLALSSLLCEVEESRFMTQKTRGHWLELEFGDYNKENFR